MVAVPQFFNLIALVGAVSMGWFHGLIWITEGGAAAAAAVVAAAVVADYFCVLGWMIVIG